MSYQKTIVYGNNSIFANYHQAEAHAATISHWCSKCKTFKSVGSMNGGKFICEICKNELSTPNIEMIQG